MKYLTFALLIVPLALTTLFSCKNANTADVSGGEKSSENSIADRSNPSDNLTKKEVIDRMNKAHSSNQNALKGAEPNEMVKEKLKQGGRIGAGQAEQSSRNSHLRYEKVKDLPPSAEQKRIGDKICACLNSNPLFKSLSTTNSSEALIKKAGDGKDREVKALQNCYNNIMVPAVSELGEDAGIFSMKSRTYLNEKCLNGTDEFWINIGAYLSRNSKKAAIEINMLEKENNQ